MKPQPVALVSTIFACLAALLAVVLGALGAHALTDRLTLAGTAAVWQTAVDYQMWHALALLLISTGGGFAGVRAVRLGRLCFALGIVFFSGSLYGLALGGPAWLGPVTPIGGSFFIAGWISLMVGLLSPSSAPD